jgi:large subunit ribosomal protein L9
MKVILLEELKGRGGEGDVIDVSTGYAVNFLLPRKIAITATKGNLKQLELRKHNIAKREETRLDSADKLMAALEGQTVRIGAKVGEEGQLFGSVTPAQVAEAINGKFGTEIDRKRIDLHGVIKTAGEHSATISVYRELKATITIEVVDEKILAAALQAASAEAADAAEAAGAEEAVAAESADEAAEAVEAEEAVAVESVVETLEAVEARLEDVAATLVEAAEAAESAGGDEADITAIADAAVEVLQDVERAIDAAIVDADVAEAEATDVEAAEADVAEAEADTPDADTVEGDVAEESEN